MNKTKKNMRLVTTFWGNDRTFKLMPVTNDCPYMEVIYDPNTDMLVVISKTMKENLQMIPRLDDDGNQITVRKPKANGKPWKEKQIVMKVPQEFYLIERDEQISFIKDFAENANEYDYNSFFEVPGKSESVIHTPEQPPLVDKTVNL